MASCECYDVDNNDYYVYKKEFNNSTDINIEYIWCEITK
jgi:hypothetical protein